MITNETKHEASAPHNHEFERPDLAALAALYWSPPESNLLREDLLERARLALAKYDLEQEQLE